MNIQDELILVKESQQNPKAFSPLFQLYYPKIFNYVMRRVGSVMVAEDITSEVFFKAVKNLWQFRWKGVPFSSWLYRIAGNEIKKYYRKGKYACLSLDKMREDGIIDPSDSIDLVEELRRTEDMLLQHKEFLQVQKLLRTLPSQYQEVMSLRFFEDKKIIEIAQILGKKHGTVKSLLSRGIALLKDKMLKVQYENSV